MSTRPTMPGMNDVVLEHLRMGTRDQYESEWRQLATSGTRTFTHELGEVPWTVDIITSRQSDGAGAVEAVAADTTVAKTDTTITVTNGGSDTLYFKVRAM